MKKLLIGAMMASLFMMGSDANAGIGSSLKSLFGKSKSTSDLSTSKSTSTSNLKKSKSDSDLVVKKGKKTKAENIDDFVESMGKYFESAAEFISVHLAGWESVLKSLSSNPTYFGKGLRGEANRNAQKNVKIAIKAFNKTNALVQKLLKGSVSDTDSAVASVTSLQESLISLVGSDFWKCFGNHIRYSMINVRNSLNMLLFPDLPWNIGNVVFSLRNGSKGVNEEEYLAGRHLGSDSFNDPSQADKSSPILKLRDAFDNLIDALLEAEGYARREKKIAKARSKEILERTSNESAQELEEQINRVKRSRSGLLSKEEVSIDDEAPARRKSNSFSSVASAKTLARRAKSESDVRTQADYGVGDEMDEDAYYNAVSSNYSLTNNRGGKKSVSSSQSTLVADEFDDVTDEDYNDYMRTRVR